MKKEDFLNQAHKYLDECYSVFEKNQMTVNDIFSVFKKICSESEITYFVSCGSLLGLVRDGGNIPWDYDFDVSVPIKQVPKLLEVLSEKLPNEYFFESNFSDKKLPFYQIRIGKRGFDINHIHLDVFYLVGMPEENIQVFRKKITNLFRFRWDYLAVDFYGKGKQNWFIRFAKKTLVKIKYKKIFKLFDFKFKRLSLKYNYDSAKNLAYFTHLAEVFPKQAFEPAKVMKINNELYSVPNDPDKVLKIHYGDYMNYLSIKNRFDEFYDCIKEIDGESL